MDGEKVRLTTDRDTGLTTVYAKAVDGEGVIEYLPTDGRNAMLKRITDHFPSGEMVLDVYGRLKIRPLTLASRFMPGPVTLHGGINDPHELEVEVPRLHLVEAVPFLTMSDMVARLPQTRLQTAIYHHWLEHARFYRRSMQHLRCRF